ncbi:MATE family efflux transporter [Clostridium sp. UBA6640]|uniref:MATE family efflux transporter n=1 Tax=Clostridium sp. UBA6640 TaxID=1946370 RepID=UPI0025C18973|nr:MATE family efflux transporter [Clostridium sp. UBA6640]
MSKRTDLLNDDIKKIFIKYLIPSIAGMLGISLNILFDTIFIGRGVGSEGLAALSIAIPMYNVLGAVGLLLGIGGATAASVSMGQKEYDKVNEIFTTSIIISIFLGVLFTVFGVVFIDKLCYFLGATEEIFSLVKDYLGILMIFSSAFILSQVLAVFVRNDRNPKLAMWSVLIGNLSNVVLDYIFIMKLGWGMKGAITATVCSPTITLLLLSLHFIKGNNTLKAKINKFKLNVHTITRIFKNGTPSFIMEMSNAMIIFAFNNVIWRLVGSIGVSAYSIIANISLICSAIFYGISQAIQPIISINYGAGKEKRVYKSLKLAIITAGIFGIIFYSIGLIFPELIVSLFNNENAELMTMTAIGIKLYFTAFIFMGCNISMASYFQSIENARASSIVSISRGVVFILIGLMILPKFLGINGVWLTVAFAESISLIVAFVCFKKFKKSYTLKQVEVVAK